MKNHNEGVEGVLIKAAAEQAVNIHDKPAYALDHEGRRMQEAEHTGIELSGAELAYFKKIIVEHAKELKTKIAATERSLEGRGVANTRNAEEELQSLRTEFTFVEAIEKKLFEKKEVTDAN